MNPEERYEPGPASVRAARRFVAAHLTGNPADLDVILLLVSELATNAVRHARSSFIVRLHYPASVLRVEVEDHNPTPPIVQPVDHSRPTGRGLQIVQSLASAWGVEPRPGGKTIWFEHPLPT